MAGGGWTAEGFAQLMPYYSNLLGAQMQGGGTGRLWDAFKTGYQQAWGTEPTGVSIQDMNHMQQYLGAAVNAMGSYNAMPGDNPISGEQWAWAPWTGYAGGGLDPGALQARVEATILLPDGTTHTINYTFIPTEGLNLTKDQLNASILGDLQTDLDGESPGLLEQLGGQTGGIVVSIDSVMILGWD